MRYTGLNGREYILNEQKYDKIRKNASQLHKNSYQALKKQFPHDIILHECSIKGFPKTLYFDIIVPRYKLIIEVQGQQHETFNSFHFENRVEFLRAQNRDRLKKEWCEKNGFKLVEFWYNESEEEWVNKL